MAKLINLPSILILFIFLLVLIVFDAAQQHFYVRTFDLNGNDLALLLFIKLHTVRWFHWLVFTIPVLFFIWHLPIDESKVPNSNYLFKIAGLSLLTVLVSIMTITVSDIYQQGHQFSLDIFMEFGQFFLYQKGMIFLLAQVGVILWTINFKNIKTIDAQWQEIELLKTKNEDANKPALTSLIVKNGDLKELIPIDDIIWIQADDYCVRVHTSDKSFYLRKSMKYLELKLKEHFFIRIHRGALLNLRYLKNYHHLDDKVTLKNEVELSVSKTGKSKLRQHLEYSPE